MKFNENRLYLNCTETKHKIMLIIELMNETRNHILVGLGLNQFFLISFENVSMREIESERMKRRITNNSYGNRRNGCFFFILISF